MGIKVFEFLRRKQGSTPRAVPDRVDATSTGRCWRIILTCSAMSSVTSSTAGCSAIPIAAFDGGGSGRRVGCRRRAVVRLGRGDAGPQQRAGHGTHSRPGAGVSRRGAADRPHRGAGDHRCRPETRRGRAKMLCILRRNAALDLDTFHDHWLHHHGGLFQDIPELREPLLGYDQNHGLRDPDAAFDGVTEQWFESLDTFVKSLSVPAVTEQGEPGRRLHARSGQHPLRDDQPAHGAGRLTGPAHYDAGEPRSAVRSGAVGVPVLGGGRVITADATEPVDESSAVSRTSAASMRARWVNACGKLPICSPVAAISSENSPRWLA